MHSPPPLLWNYVRFEKNSFQNKYMQYPYSWQVFCTPISEFSGSAPVFIVWLRQAYSMTFFVFSHLWDAIGKFQYCSNTFVIVYPVIIYVLQREQMRENLNDWFTKHSTLLNLCYINMISLLPYVLGVIQPGQSIPC